MRRVMTKPRKVLLIATAALLLGTAAHAGSQTIPPLAELIPKGNQGNAVAQFALGMKYYYGEGAPQDYAEAMKWYRKAADQGEVRSQYNVGLMNEIGQSVPQDYAEAMKWFRKAADQGDVNGQVGVGAMYFEGQGVPQDYAEAKKW